jgi:hypothetical protein
LLTLKATQSTYQVDVGISIVAKNDRPFLGVVRCDALIGDIKIVLGGGATYVDSFVLYLLPRLHEFHSARTNVTLMRHVAAMRRWMQSWMEILKKTIISELQAEIVNMTSYVPLSSS